MNTRQQLNDMESGSKSDILLDEKLLPAEIWWQPVMLKVEKEQILCLALIFKQGVL